MAKLKPHPSNILPPKDPYAKYKRTSPSFLAHQASIITSIRHFLTLSPTDTDQTTSTQINQPSTSTQITTMLGPPPVSPHTLLLVELWWYPQIESIFQQWLTLLHCPTCGMGLYEIYRHSPSPSPFPSPSSLDPPSTPPRKAPRPLLDSPSPIRVRRRLQDKDKDKDIEEVEEEEEGKQKVFNEDPWELLVGTKNVLMDVKPWELTQGFLDEVRERWNRGSEMFLFEEGVGVGHLRPLEGDDCGGFGEVGWVWI